MKQITFFRRTMVFSLAVLVLTLVSCEKEPLNSMDNSPAKFSQNITISPNQWTPSVDNEFEKSFVIDYQRFDVNSLNVSDFVIGDVVITDGFSWKVEGNTLLLSLKQHPKDNVHIRLEITPVLPLEKHCSCLKNEDERSTL